MVAKSAKNLSEQEKREDRENQIDYSHQDEWEPERVDS